MAASLTLSKFYIILFVYKRILKNSDSIKKFQKYKRLESEEPYIKLDKSTPYSRISSNTKIDKRVLKSVIAQQPKHESSLPKINNPSKTIESNDSDKVDIKFQDKNVSLIKITHLTLSRSLISN